MSITSGRLWPGAVVGAALVVMLFGVTTIALGPAEELVTHVPDDTFYYLVLARNLVATGALTFDGVNPASGVHPAWLGLMSLLTAAGLDGFALVRAAIVLALLCHLVTSWYVALIVRDAGAPDVASWAGALWLVNPISLGLVIEAMEAPLFVMALAGAVLAVSRMLGRGEPTPAALTRLSAIFGALCLVRTDGIFVAGVAVLLIGFARVRAGASARRTIATMAVLSLGPCVAIAAFALWLRMQTGYFTQASGELKMFWGGLAGTEEKLAFLYHVFGRLTFGAFAHAMFGLPTKISAAAGVLGGAAVAVLAWKRWRAGDVKGPLITFWLLGAAAAATAIYALVLFEYRAWYLGLPAFAFFMALVLEAARRSSPGVFATGATIAFAAMGLEVVRLAHADAGRYPYARAIYESVEVFDRLVPPEEPIGSFDAGVRGFFAQHRVINLDGLVNDATRPYWRSGQMGLYLEHAGISYVADEAGSFDLPRRLGPFPDMERLACVPARGTAFNDRCLWRVRAR